MGHSCLSALKLGLALEQIHFYLVTIMFILQFQVSKTSSEDKKSFPPLPSNFTKFSFTPVSHIGDELLNSTSSAPLNRKNSGLESIPWQPIEFPDSSNTNTVDGTHSKRDNARSFDSFMTSVALQNTTDGTTVTTPQPNITTSERPEIKEPVLSAAAVHLSLTNSDANSTYSEITEPVLNPKKLKADETSSPRPSLVKPREISIDASGKFDTQDSKWIPAQELNPPPLGGTPTWQHWMTETKTVSPSEEKPKSDENSESAQGRRLGMPSPTEKSAMIQFFPQRLAALLAQAEYYARLTLSFPITAVSKLIGHKSPQSGDLAMSASTSKLYTLNVSNRKPKQFITVKPPSDELSAKANKSEKSSRIRNISKIIQENNIYVPYSYSSNKDTVEISRFIPLSQFSLAKNANYKYNTEQSISLNKNISGGYPVNKTKAKKDDDISLLHYIYPRIPER